MYGINKIIWKSHTCILLCIILGLIIICYMELFLSVDKELININVIICSKHYTSFTIEIIMCSLLGSKYPYMRDDLIRRKLNGEDMITRHINTWSDHKNWLTSTVSATVYPLLIDTAEYKEVLL